MTIERLLVVGGGNIGQRHLRLARQLLPDADIRVLRQRGGEHPDDTAVLTSLDAALAFAPQAAVIAGPAAMHVQMALPLAQRGVHLLVEKPIDADPELVPSLLEAAAASGIVLLTGYNLRYLPSLQSLRQQVLDGRVGRIISVRAEVGQYLPSWRPKDYRQTVSASRQLGGGVLLELSHEIDYLRWIFGDIEWVKAFVGKQSALEIDVEDCAHLILGFERRDDRQLVARLDLDFIRHDTSRSCLAIGETGTLRWNALAGTVELFAAGASEWVLLSRQPHAGDDSYLAQWRHFIACIDGHERVCVDAGDALLTLKVVDAARRSGGNNDAIALKELPR